VRSCKAGIVVKESGVFFEKKRRLTLELLLSVAHHAVERLHNILLFNILNK
jgi:hypothetical protein